MKTIFSQSYAGTHNKVVALDNPGPGGAHHEYLVFMESADSGPEPLEVKTNFQKGPIKEAGLNGIQNEHLVAMVIDRLKGFQAGPFACEANAETLQHLEKAMECMEKRTADRANRGVEGKNLA